MIAVPAVIELEEYQKGQTMLEGHTCDCRRELRSLSGIITSDIEPASGKDGVEAAVLPLDSCLTTSVVRLPSIASHINFDPGLNHFWSEDSYPTYSVVPMMYFPTPPWAAA